MPSAGNIFGVPYGKVGNVFTGEMMGTAVDKGSFTDDNTLVPSYYSFTINDGAQTVTLKASSIIGVASVSVK